MFHLNDKWMNKLIFKKCIIEHVFYFTIVCNVISFTWFMQGSSLIIDYIVIHQTFICLYRLISAIFGPISTKLSEISEQI